MIPTRRFLALPALALALVLGACSTPDDLTAPTLEPQFGTSDYDSVDRVAYNKNGHLYAAGDLGSVSYLRRYDRAGSLLWERFFEVDAAYRDYSNRLLVRAVAVDGSGNAYVSWTAYYHRWNEETHSSDHVTKSYLSKYDRNGARKFRLDARDFHDLKTDSVGNVYAIAGGKGYLTKYTATGSKAWERYGFPEPQSLAVSTANNAYLVRKDGFVAKYTGSGSRTWLKKLLPGHQDYFQPDDREEYCYNGCTTYSVSYQIAPGLNDEFHIVGGEVSDEYDGDSCGNTDAHLNLYRFDKNGVQQSKKSVMDLHEGGCWEYHYSYDGWSNYSITTDSLGNTYIATAARGGACDEGSDKYESCVDAIVAKYSSAGGLVWRKGFGTINKLDAAVSVATADGKEVYVGGYTNGALAHRHLGGTDAFLRRMDASGNRVWTR